MQFIRPDHIGYAAFHPVYLDVFRIGGFAYRIEKSGLGRRLLGMQVKELGFRRSGPQTAYDDRRRGGGGNDKGQDLRAEVNLVGRSIGDQI